MWVSTITKPHGQANGRERNEEGNGDDLLRRRRRRRRMEARPFVRKKRLR